MSYTLPQTLDFLKQPKEYVNIRLVFYPRGNDGYLLKYQKNTNESFTKMPPAFTLENALSDMNYSCCYIVIKNKANECVLLSYKISTLRNSVLHLINTKDNKEVGLLFID